MLKISNGKARRVVRGAGLWLALVGACTGSWADRRDDDWQRVSDPPKVFGLDGRPHKAACSGYPGTDPSYSFWHKRGKSKNLVVYFEGGGACWDDFSCTFPIADGLPPALPQTFVPQVPPNTHPASYSGIFDDTQAANPVKDWSFVYIPYCTGDVHSGSADRTYKSVGNPVFQLPQDTPFDIHHGGFDNFMVVLDWMRKNADKPEQILVAGSSAGGYGASTNFPWVQRAFPKAKMAVLADASQGVLSPPFDVITPGRNSWNPQLAPWVFGSNVNAVASGSILSTAAKALPDVRVGQFTTQFDAVQIQFYALSLMTYQARPSCSYVDQNTAVAVSWNHGALAGLQASVAAAPNYRYYLSAGNYHTILRSPQFYSEASAGVPFSAWTAALLKKGGAGDDDEGPPRNPHSAWRNLACPGCLLALPCPP